MTPYKHLGELGLLTNESRAATIIASENDVILGYMEQGDFNTIFRDYFQNLNYPYTKLK